MKKAFCILIILFCTISTFCNSANDETFKTITLFSSNGDTIAMWTGKIRLLSFDYSDRVSFICNGETVTILGTIIITQ